MNIHQQKIPLSSPVMYHNTTLSDTDFAKMAISTNDLLTHKKESCIGYGGYVKDKKTKQGLSGRQC